MSADSDFESDRPKPSPRRGFRLIELFLCLAVLGLLFALLVPATRSSRGAAQRAACSNNLRQIALALQNYEGAYGALPPAHTSDASGRPLHSWRTLILPFLGEESLYRRIDLAKPWNDEANAAAADAMPSVFRCPGANGPSNTTTYLAIVGPSACFLPSQPRRQEEITNDPGATLMLIEAGSTAAVPWMAPSDADESLVLGLNATSAFNHGGGTHGVFVNGSVRFIRADESSDARRRMLTIVAGDEQSKDSDALPQALPGKVE